MWRVLRLALILTLRLTLLLTLTSALSCACACAFMRARVSIFTMNLKHANVIAGSCPLNGCMQDVRQMSGREAKGVQACRRHKRQKTKDKRRHGTSGRFSIHLSLG
jgi:hypothetical protein